MISEAAIRAVLEKMRAYSDIRRHVPAIVEKWADELEAALVGQESDWVKQLRASVAMAEADGDWEATAELTLAQIKELLGMQPLPAPPQESKP